MLQDALDILEADDGKSFEEKRDAVISQLKQKNDSELARLLVEPTKPVLERKTHSGSVAGLSGSTIT